MLASEEALRSFELESVEPWLMAGGNILEIGGGTGFQAAHLSKRGYAVVSIDLPARERVARHFPVGDYDGVRVPFRSASFDTVFSSNVLEHVVDLSGLFVELSRVLKPGGRAVHVVPTPAWRVWTSLGYPLYVLRRRRAPTARRMEPREGAQAVTPRRSLVAKATTLAFAGPHGEAPNAGREVLAWTARAWSKRFEAEGWVVEATEPLGCWYTGNQLAPRLPVAARRRMARFLGSAMRLYVLTPNR
jgi:SAM-dependent methyltransferase